MKPGIANVAILPAALALLLAGAQDSLALSGVEDFYIRNWKAEEGLPENTVDAVVQTRDGYLWFGCYDGLLRFDGVKFTLFNNDNAPEMHDNAVTCLSESRDGALWIGHESGEVTRYQNWRFEAVSQPKSTESSKVLAIGVDARGDAWSSNDRGALVRVKDGKVGLPSTPNAMGMASFVPSTNGFLWTFAQGALYQLRDGHLTPMRVESQALADNVRCIAPASNGALWVVRSGRLEQWNDAGAHRDFGQVPWSNAFVNALQETRSGSLVAGVTEQGLYVFRPETVDQAVHLSRTNGLSGDWILSLASDYEGNIWAGTGGSGLMMMREKQVKTLSPPDAWQNRSVMSVTTGRDGALWTGTEGGGLYRFKEGQWSNYGYADQLHTYVWSVVEDPQGGLWAGTWGMGLFAFRSNVFEKVFDSETRWPNISALLCSKSGGLWVGSETGLIRCVGQEAIPYPPAIGQSMRRTRSLVEDREGGVWFGTVGNGLGYAKDGVVRQYRKSDGLASDFISALHLDSEGVLWIGTAGSGLCRYKDGKFAALGIRQGLADAHICHIEEDDLGYFWMSSHGGIMRVAKAELDLCLDQGTNEVSCLRYGLVDGLPTVTCSGALSPSGCKLADGQLCFATVKGLVIIDPHKVKIDSTPLPVLIEKMTVDDRLAGKGDDLKTEIRIPPGWHRVEFDYTGLSFATAERVHFKYRVEGLDSDWLDAGTKRMATYNRVPPGDYVFHVIACNREGVWNRAGASVCFSIKPFFWQTWWFQVLCVTGLVGFCSAAVWFEGRRRMHRTLELSERRRAVEAERARIARDIHDDLGAQLTRISMLSESVAGWLDDPERTRSGVIRINDTTRDLIRSLDETVWAVNPQRDSLEGLANYLEKYALGYLEASGIRCRLDLPMQFPKWPLTSEVRHNVFLAFKEALNNLVKHAGASEAALTLRLRENGFELEIRDNGRGFDTTLFDRESAHPTGNGLQNMRARLVSAGGICRISSIPGEGTKVVLEVQITDYTG